MGLGLNVGGVLAAVFGVGTPPLEEVRENDDKVDKDETRRDGD